MNVFTMFFTQILEWHRIFKNTHRKKFIPSTLLQLYACNLHTKISWKSEYFSSGKNLWWKKSHINTAHSLNNIWIFIVQSLLPSLEFFFIFCVFFFSFRISSCSAKCCESVILTHTQTSRCQTKLSFKFFPWKYSGRKYTTHTLCEIFFLS